jgi:hypothetical protein
MPMRDPNLLSYAVYHTLVISDMESSDKLLILRTEMFAMFSHVIIRDTPHWNSAVITLRDAVVHQIIHWALVYRVSRDGSVGMATRYGLDDPGIESPWGRSFPHRPWGPPSLLYNGYWASFPGVKRPGCSVNHPPPYSAEVKERVELNLKAKQVKHKVRP